MTRDAAGVRELRLVAGTYEVVWWGEDAELARSTFEVVRERVELEPIP